MLANDAWSHWKYQNSAFTAPPIAENTAICSGDHFQNTNSPNNTRAEAMSLVDLMELVHTGS